LREKRRKETRRFGNQVECFEVKYGRNTLEINRAGQPAAGRRSTELRKYQRSKRQEARNKKQETRDKKQEERNKRREARSKRQKIRLRLDFFASLRLCEKKKEIGLNSRRINMDFFISCSDGKFRCFGKKI
jgi:alpha-galactosidase/6-phospho-beta-glucosidase family protein